MVPDAPASSRIGYGGKAFLPGVDGRRCRPARRGPGCLVPTPLCWGGAAMSPTGPKHYHAFVSYNAQDRRAVEEVAVRLKGEGLELYLEAWELLPGREFQPALARALQDSMT